MIQTEQLLDKLATEQLMEPSFDIGLISKLKAAKKLYQKAQSKWKIHLASTNFDETVQHYFHNISSSLIHCVDVHMDALRFCEAALLSYKRQALAEEIEIAVDCKLQLEQVMSFLGASKKQNLNFREILVNANLHVSHDNILANLIIALRSYLISNKELQPILN